MKSVSLPASYYQQFDADPGAEVPAENFGGWKETTVELSTEHTALVVMHAYDSRNRDAWPGWRRAVEYLPRAQKIAEEIFPDLFKAVRSIPLPIFHVVGQGNYHRDMPGFKKTLDIVGSAPEYDQVASDEVYERLKTFREEQVFAGKHNRSDVNESQRHRRFMPTAEPQSGELIAENSHQLAGLCLHHEINHLIYTGFAINWCLLMFPGGMVDMDRHGILCSTIREAVTAVENAETAREEREKQQALWRVALNFGFVFGVDDFIGAMRSIPAN